MERGRFSQVSLRPFFLGLAVASLIEPSAVYAGTAPVPVEGPKARAATMSQIDSRIRASLSKSPALVQKVRSALSEPEGKQDDLSRRLAEIFLEDAWPSHDAASPAKPIDPRSWDELTLETEFANWRNLTFEKAMIASKSIAPLFADGSGLKYRRVRCGDEKTVHGLLTETATYDAKSKTIEICERFWPKPFDRAEWVKSLTESNRSPASTEGDSSETVVPTPPEREPASVAQKQRPHNKQASNRRSRLPSSVHDGFEFRAQYGKLVSTFWVVKRGDRHDLIFANSGGSRATVALPPESFSYLQSSAQGIPQENTDPGSCGGASFQIHVIAAGSPERTSTTCMKGKTKTADGLRRLGGLLSTMVR